MPTILRLGTCLLLLAGLQSACRSATAPSPPATVAAVDLVRYTGTWYEIKKIPNRFQDHCQRDTTATYSLRDDGLLSVVNACTDNNNLRDEAVGVARIVDSASNAKLEVSFVELLGLHLFWGDYWIIELADDYRYVIVGTPNRKYGWVLARNKTVPAADHARIEKRLREQGYDPRAFIASPQSP
ncbi:MAG: lipocalin family protein [Granulosicoccaceae bacterium]|jgi:apolipoprotein D and lipocalin family protein